MGNMVVIYDTGQTYEIDSDLIYTPWFLMGRRSGKTIISVEIVKQALGDLDEKENNLSEVTGTGT